MKEVRLNSIDYTTKDGTTWKANILSHSIDDSIALIKSNVPDFDRIYGTSAGKKIDALTDDVKKLFIVKKEIIVTNTKAVGDANTGIVCPFCDKSFKNKKTFKNHLIKYHT
jgi:hypothetical protein